MPRAGCVSVRTRHRRPIFFSTVSATAREFARYDVTHSGRVNSRLGTDEEFDDLCEKLKHYGMGLLLDIVPNHMAASHENAMWMDVLENGPDSPYAHFFGIDWRPFTPKAASLLEDKILLPVLGDLSGAPFTCLRDVRTKRLFID